MPDYKGAFLGACQHLCNVLYQLYAGYAEEDTGVYRTSYNADAVAVKFLAGCGYVEILEGKYLSKYISFKFTDKFDRESEYFHHERYEEASK